MAARKRRPGGSGSPAGPQNPQSDAARSPQRAGGVHQRTPAAPAAPSARVARVGPAARASDWLQGVLPVGRVPDGVEYTGILRTATYTPLMAFLGIVVGIGSFYSFVPLVTRLLATGYWVAIGQPGTFAETYASLLRYEHPFGIVAAQLGLAMLFPITWALLRLIHQVPPGSVFSVAGRLRWRPLLVFGGVALVSLNAVYWINNALLGSPFTWSPQAGLAGFLVAIVLTSPLQAAAEEVFFRGYLLLALGSQVPVKWFGILASAFVFALFHGTQNLWLFASRFAFGVLAGVLVVYTGGLEAGIAAHAVNNVFGFVYAGLSTGIAEHKGVRELGPAEAAGEIAMYAVFTVLALLVARRLRLQTRTGAGTPQASGLVRGVEVR